MTRAFAITLNALSLYAVALVLAAAFAAQLLLHELPCPLCLLQRLQFTLLAIGPILNVRYGPRPSHYALSLSAAAKALGVSTGHLSRTFPRMTHMTFREYVLSRRIDFARRLLLDPLNNISGVSDSCGFSTPAYFARVFRNRERGRLHAPEFTMLEW